MNYMARFGNGGGGGGGPQFFATPTNLTRELVDIWFAYDFSFGNLLAGASATQSIPTQADANFLWEEMNFTAQLNGASEPISSTIQYPFTLQLTDSGVGRFFFAGSQGQAAVPLNSIGGSGQFPYVLPTPYLIRAVSTMQAIVTSTSVNQWNNLHLTLIGKKTFASYPVNGPAIS